MAKRVSLCAVCDVEDRFSAPFVERAGIFFQVYATGSVGNFDCIKALPLPVNFSSDCVNESLHAKWGTEDTFSSNLPQATVGFPAFSFEKSGAHAVGELVVLLEIGFGNTFPQKRVF